MEISGAAALVTGGASGLGAATARALAAAGAVVTVLDVQDEAGEALAADLGGGARFVHADVTNTDQVATAVSLAAENHPLRVAVSCAGIGSAARTIDRDGTPADLTGFRRVIEVNLVGTFNVTAQAAAVIARTDELEHGERGVIVNTASVAAFEGQVGQAAYSASKGGVVGMTLPIARDLARVGIRVCTVAPGIIGTDPITGDTTMMAGLDERFQESLAASVPFPQRLGWPSEYAQLVMAIIANGYMNGEVIRLDGALRMAPR